MHIIQFLMIYYWLMNDTFSNKTNYILISQQFVALIRSKGYVDRCQYKGSISLDLHSAPIDSQGRQVITRFCILMGSYFTITASRSVVMTYRSRLPPRLVWYQSSGQQCYCQKESPGDLFVLRYCPSSNSLCTKHDIFSSKK